MNTLIKNSIHPREATRPETPPVFPGSYTEHMGGNEIMKEGNWVGMDKRLVSTLPNDRPLTDLEAMFSYTVNRDNGVMGSISGYAARWKWSRSKVRRFIRTIETGGDYLTDSHRTGKRQAIRFINNNLKGAQNRDQDTRRDTIKEPNPDPKDKRHFRDLETDAFRKFYGAYPKKKGRANAIKAWNKLSPSPELAEDILAAVAVASGSDEWKRDEGRYVPHPATWLNGRRWEDEIVKEVEDGNWGEYPIDVIG